jgi:hypothetical protein
LSIHSNSLLFISFQIILSLLFQQHSSIHTDFKDFYQILNNFTISFHFILINFRFKTNKISFLFFVKSNFLSLFSNPNLQFFIIKQTLTRFISLFILSLSVRIKVFYQIKKSNKDLIFILSKYFYSNSQKTNKLVLIKLLFDSTNFFYFKQLQIFGFDDSNNQQHKDYLEDQMINHRDN